MCRICSVAAALRLSGLSQLVGHFKQSGVFTLAAVRSFGCFSSRLTLEAREEEPQQRTTAGRKPDGLKLTALSLCARPSYQTCPETIHITKGFYSVYLLSLSASRF